MSGKKENKYAVCMCRQIEISCSIWRLPNPAASILYRLFQKYEEYTASCMRFFFTLQWWWLISFERRMKQQQIEREKNNTETGW